MFNVQCSHLTRHEPGRPDRRFRPAGRAPTGGMEGRLRQGGKLFSRPAHPQQGAPRPARFALAGPRHAPRARRAGTLRHANCRRGNGPPRHRMVRRGFADAAQAVITKNTQRSDKKLWTEAGDGLPVQLLSVASERAEGEAIIRRIRLGVDSGSYRLKDYAVLYRTNAQSRSIEENFVHYGLPYRVVGGVRFYDRKEIKDIVAYLRVIFQPQDRVSFERIVNIPTRGIDRKSTR